MSAGQGKAVDDDTALIGLDWGTSRLRAFRLSATGAVLEQRESPNGIAAIAAQKFDPALASLVADWAPRDREIPMLMCGMIGSRQGWREAPYSPCPAGLGDLARHLTPVTTSLGLARIVGGLTDSDPHGDHDVMRGEETQILGLPDVPSRLVVAPGTHSKWACVEAGRITRFRTYMTGEIYDLLRRHSTLGWLMRDTGEALDPDAFMDGARRALHDPDWLHLLFAVRTRGLLGQAAPAALAAYLSGLLIGAEIASARRQHGEGLVTVIAAPALAELYALALPAAGFAVQSAPAGAAVAAGLWKIWQSRRREGGP